MFGTYLKPFQVQQQILAAGASLSPAEIAKIAGYDITVKGFWQIGIRQYEYFLKQLKEITE